MNIGTLVRVVKSLCLRNRIILEDYHRKAQKGTVNLNWWVMFPDDNEQCMKYNLGDHISTVVVQWMKEKNGIVSERSCDGKTKHLYAIGSIISLEYQNATVWGSGLIRSKRFWWRKIRRLDIRSVRGPLTRKCLQENGYQCPAVYGDPAILMPLIYRPQDNVKDRDYLVIRHYVDNFACDNAITAVTDDYRKIIDQICRARLVISSSLHGIILAESYGVPAIMLRSASLDMFKYQDWYRSTERYDFPVAATVEEALTMTPPVLPQLENMQERLMEVFPVDLWL